MSNDTINLKVASRSETASVAGAIIKYLNEGCTVELTGIGAGAVNQSVKSLCVARGIAASQGENLAFTCGFTEEDVDGRVKTAVKFRVHQFSPTL